MRTARWIIIATLLAGLAIWFANSFGKPQPSVTQYTKCLNHQLATGRPAQC